MNYQDKLSTTLDSPATSYWLANALRALDSRDPVDALNDAEQLADIVTQRLKDIYPNERAGCQTIRAMIQRR